jgi:hypothetical protein
MKIVCLVLVMTTSGFTQSTAYADASHLTPQQNPAISTDAGRDHPRNTEHGGQANDNKRQKVGTRSNEPGNARHVSGKNHSRNRANLIKANRPQQLRSIPNHSTSQNVMNVHQPGSGTPAVGAAKIANRRTLPVRTAGVGALNGRQFKDSHNRRVATAIIGRTASATKGTVVINGTSTTPRHVN